MSAVRMRQVADARRRLFRRLGDEIRRLREDAGLSQASVARSAAVNQPYLSRIEAGNAAPSLDVLVRIGLALGADLGVRYFANTGPRIRDHLQVAMTEALLHELHPRWRATPEVPVYRPVHGVIDLVLEEREGGATIATELHSQLRRIEQLFLWQTQKADALALGAAQDGRSSSRLLVLRNTHAMREVAGVAAATLSAAYPARTADALDALYGEAEWPGSAIVWMTVERGIARLMAGPPRGIAVGR